MTKSLKSSPQSFVLDANIPDSIGKWRAEMDRAFPPLDIVPRDPTGFRASYRAAGTDELQVSDLSANAHTVERRPGKVTEHDLGFYKMSLQVSGTGIMMQGNREIVLTPGTIAIYDTARPYTLEFTEDYRFIVAMFPKSALSLPNGLAGDLTAHAITSDSGPGSVLSAYVMGLATNLDTLSGAPGQRLARTGLDLLSTVIASEAGDEHASSQASRRAMLITICLYINEHLADDDLTPESIADAHFISVRQLYNVFADAGVTVAQWVRTRRLMEFRRDLADPLMAAKSITQLATIRGLSDAGYYSRIFKDTFGMTPTDWRTTSGILGR